MHLDYTKVIILILWWRNFQLEYWRTFQLVSTSIDLKQYVEDTKDETDGDKITYKEVEKLDTPLIIDQSKISKDVKEFKAGASYNVYITIYGFEKIEVTAVLTAWEDGGDIETDIEDGK